jgi:hypothetical protein
MVLESGGDSSTCDTRCSNASSLWWCENTLQWCYIGVTFVLQLCYSGVTVVSHCHSGVIVVLQLFHSGVAIVLL